MSVLGAAVTLASRLGASYRTVLNMEAQTQITQVMSESAISSVNRGQWIMLRNINKVHGNSKEKFDIKVFAIEDKYKTEKKFQTFLYKKLFNNSLFFFTYFSSRRCLLPWGCKQKGDRWLTAPEHNSF